MFAKSYSTQRGYHLNGPQFLSSESPGEMCSGLVSPMGKERRTMSFLELLKFSPLRDVPRDPVALRARGAARGCGLGAAAEAGGRAHPSRRFGGE